MILGPFLQVENAFDPLPNSVRHAIVAPLTQASNRRPEVLGSHLEHPVEWRLHRLANPAEPTRAEHFLEARV